MISGFRQEIDNWMASHPLKSKEDVDEMQQVIKHLAATISREDAQQYLPALQDRVKLIQADHPLINEMQTIQESLISNDAKTILDLPLEVIILIFQQVEPLEARKNLSSVNQAFLKVLNQPIIAAKLLEKHGNQMPVDLIIQLALSAGPYLKNLNLSATDVTDQHLIQLAASKNIKNLILDLSSCLNITDEGVKNLVNISSLNISDCYKISDEGIKGLTNLRFINISGCPRLTEDAIKDLINLEGLKAIKTFSVTRDLTSVLNKLTKLTSLAIGPNNEIIDIEGLTNLQSLTLDSCRNFIGSSLKNLAQLTTFSAIYCNDITDEVIQNLTRLENLDVNFCRQLTDKAIKGLINLRSLNISECSQLTNAAIENLVNLKKLNIKSCSRLTDNAIKNLVNLEELNTSYNPNLTDQAFLSLSKLHTLDISNCYRLSPKAIMPLKHLKYLTARFCSNLFSPEFRNFCLNAGIELKK